MKVYTQCGVKRCTRGRSELGVCGRKIGGVREHRGGGGVM